MKTLKRFFRIQFYLTILLSVFFITVNSQETNNGLWSGWSVNVNGGANLFYGDIENYRYYKSFSNNSEWRFAYGFMIQKRFSPLFSIRGQFLKGNLSGTKRETNKWFEADIMETSLSATLDLINLIWGQKTRTVSVYAMAGIGLSNWTTDLKNFETNENIGGNGHNTGRGIGGRTLEGVLPFGLGIDFRLSDHWNINVEGTLRPVNSDLLDAYEGGFKFDFYSYDFVGITYNFGKKKEKEPLLPTEELIVQETVQIPEEIEPQPQEELIPVKDEIEEEFRKLEKELLEADAETGIYESPWKGVEFTVQIAASKIRIDPQKFASKYNLNNEVKVNYGNGWYRYSVGSYIKFWKAREYKNILVSRHNVYDAFIVAYKHGERLTLDQLVDFSFSSEVPATVEKQRPVTKKSFGVQIIAFRDKDISVRAVKELYAIEQEVYKEFLEGWYQYTTGNFNTYKEAAKLRNKLKLKGVSDAFVVGYKEGVRVKLSTILD